ncbi:putative universal stress protein [Diaporthe ampelina]|uniref:Putative universal stress protein n=1 Tax=Diaporthe ampelina TaxID=1214573 RepID=A0A0G2FZB0_9PEZI|nr:putative universal stress protein [Diaporthe ampelina]
MASLTEDGSHRFRKHVTFNNVQIGEPTKNNFPSYTLVVRHLGFYSKRRSRTFMVGIDDHQYSDEALQWLFDKFVEDGDEIICVRVVEKDVRQLETDRRIADFQQEANAEVERIKAKSGDSKAISIVLEYAVVVVVRPDEKRQKKKGKRDADPEKQSYRQMLQSNHGIHEADSDAASAWGIESKLTADEEAGKVARAMGLPAKFDPTLKPFKKADRQRSSLSQISQATSTDEPGRLISTPTMTPTVSAANSEDEGSGDEDEEGEGEFEVTSGAQLLKAQRKELEEKQKEQEKKDRLHKMEVGEAAALLKHKPGEEDEDDEDEDEDDEDGGGAIRATSPE